MLLDAKIIQDSLEELMRWEYSVIEFFASPFLDEVTLIFGRFNLPDPYKLFFTGCRKICVEHPWGKISGSYWTELPIKDWGKGPLGNTFIMRDIKVENIKKYDIDLYEFHINADPIRVNIICKDFKINDQNIEDYLKNT